MNPSIYFEVIADYMVDKAVEFNGSTQSVTIEYMRNFKAKINGIKKFVANLSTEREYIFSPPVKMFPIVTITKKFDFASYWSATENERKKTILETLQESVLDMCEKMELDKTPFEKAYQEVQNTLQVL